MTHANRGASFVNSGIRDAPAAGRFRIDASAHRLQWNENPFDFPVDLKEEVLHRLAKREWSRYPLGMRAYDLMDRVAEHVGVSPEMVLIGNGSSDLIRMTMAATLQAGSHVVVPSPTFLLYQRHAKMLEATVHEIPLAPEVNFALPVDDLIDSARSNQARLIVICAPNNPTGTVHPSADLRRVLDEAGALVIIDEAYGDFSGQDLTPLLDDFDNLVLIRTFSKVYAMAGVRVGYALAAASLAAELQKVVNTFTLSHFAETTAMVALDHHERFMSTARLLCEERDRMAAELSALPGVRVFPSGTNFLLVRPELSAATISKSLLANQRILISDVSAYPELDNYLRISVGTPEQNDLLVEGFAACVG